MTTGREIDAEAIREVYGIDPDLLIDAKFRRAALAAGKTERGGEIVSAMIHELSNEDLDRMLLEAACRVYGLDPEVLTDEQAERVRETVNREYVESITVPADEWEGLRSWLDQNRDIIRATKSIHASSCGQLVYLADGRRISVTCLASYLKCGDRSDQKARQWAADAVALRETLGAATRG